MDEIRGSKKKEKARKRHSARKEKQRKNRQRNNIAQSEYINMQQVEIFTKCGQSVHKYVKNGVLRIVEAKTRRFNTNLNKKRGKENEKGKELLTTEKVQGYAQKKAKRDEGKGRKRDQAFSIT